MTQTLTGLYDSYDTALQVSLRLKDAGFRERDVSPLASRVQAPADATGPSADYAGTGAAVGGVLGAATGLMVSTGVLAIPAIGPVVAAGWLASTLAMGAAGVAAGGLTGGVVGALSGTGTQREIQAYAASVRRGETLVTVLTPDERAVEAARILTAFPSVDPASRVEFRNARSRSNLGAGGGDGAVLPSGLPRTP